MAVSIKSSMFSEIGRWGGQKALQSSEEGGASQGSAFVKDGKDEASREDGAEKQHSSKK